MLYYIYFITIRFQKTKSKQLVRQNTNDTLKINWMSWRSTIIEDLLSLLDYPVELIWEDSGYGFSVPRYSNIKLDLLIHLI